jgi:uncharacterized protein YdaU (DUF1376 family)
MFWFRYRCADMEAMFLVLSEDAELIAHRLARRYFAKRGDIPANVKAIARETRVSEDRVQDAWEDLNEVFDLSGACVRCAWLDDEVDRAKTRSAMGRHAAKGRWGGDDA